MKRSNINKVLKDLLKNHKMNQQNTKNSPYKTESDYEKSFTDILKFRSEFSPDELKRINTVIYHDENNDGMGSAAIAWKFLTHDNNKTVKYIPLKPGRIAPEVHISGKHVLLLDIDIDKSKRMIDLLDKKADSVIVIDDHGSLKPTKKIKVFAGNPSSERMEHATVAYTWKFFYPQQKVPMFIQYIDSQDAKLYMPFTPFSELVSDAIGFRLVHDKTVYKNRQTQPQNILKDLWSIIDESNTNFWIFIGKYFAEVTENLKDQIAKNAVRRKFQGYCVGVLNFNAPALAKKVGLQIISNFENKGQPVDFAVTWGYEYTSNAYRIGLMRRPWENSKIDLGAIAKKLGAKGGHPKGGGGHGPVGNFYWPRSSKQDIWDLFEGNC
jgi:hypothetical protein